MAIFRPLNEFTCEPVVFALEPSRTCAAHCTYCFATLNAAKQYANRSKRPDDDGTFESNLTKAYSPSYEPTNILQFALRNRLAIGYANGVEPFQNVSQAKNLLQALEQFDIPIFLQLKGLNFPKVIDQIEPFYDNSAIFVSIPSLDDRFVKRFEPGTPQIQERLEMIKWFSDNGFWVIGALSPYHEKFCSNPEDLVNTLTRYGVNQIFFDRLHLNERQTENLRDPLIREYAGGLGKKWPNEAYEHLRRIYNTAIDNGLEFFSTGFHGTAYGQMNTTPSIAPVEVYKRGNGWPYYDGLIFNALESLFYTEEITPANRNASDSFLFTWDDCVRLMEVDWAIDQKISYSSLTDIIQFYRKIPEVWKRHIGKEAPMREFYRALYNSPHRNQFVIRHPWIYIASDDQGIPLLDLKGNVQMLFDPDWHEPIKRYFRPAGNLNQYRTLEFTE